MPFNTWRTTPPRLSGPWQRRPAVRCLRRIKPTRPAHCCQRGRKTCVIQSAPCVGRILTLAALPTWRQTIVAVIESHTPAAIGAAIGTLAWLFADVVCHTSSYIAQSCCSGKSDFSNAHSRIRIPGSSACSRVVSRQSNVQRASGFESPRRVKVDRLAAVYIRRRSLRPRLCAYSARPPIRCVETARFDSEALNSTDSQTFPDGLCEHRSTWSQSRANISTGRTDSPNCIRSTYNLPFRWSISCATTLALKPENSRVWRMPSTV